MRIGQVIQRLRKERNQTQETVAAELGVTIGAVSKWETKQLAFRYGADEWISKPFLPEQIVTCAVKETENEK